MNGTDYTRDFIAFFRDLFPLENGAAIIPPFLESWLHVAFPLPEGNPAERNILHSTSKKQGKSTLGAAVALYMAGRRRYSEVVIAASDKDQSRDRVFRSVKYAVENGAAWKNAKVFKDVIELDQGSIIQAISADWKGAAGGTYDCVVFDELWTATSELERRRYDELIIPPQKPAGVRWIASYAGFLGESALLKEIWDKALAGGRVSEYLPIFHSPGAYLAFIDQGEASWRMPWTTPEYMQQVRGTERPNTFRRLWLNEWVSAESEFISPEKWEACYSPDARPLGVGDKRRVIFGADASTSRDLTALVGVIYDPRLDLAEVAYARTWKPAILAHAGAVIRGGKPTVDLSETIGAEILRLYKAGQVEAVYYDPYQLHSIAVDLTKAGVRMVELPQTAQRVEADQALYDAIIGRALRHYGDPALTEHINNAVAIETPRGFRLAKERTSRKIDAAVALSMAHYGAIHEQKAIGEARGLPNIFYDYDFANLDDFAEVGGKMVYMPARRRGAHPEGVTWRNCKNRNRGCEACILELESEGYYNQLAAEAERYANRPEPNSPEEQAELDRFLSRLPEGETQHVYEFLRKFRQQVISKLERPG